MTMGGTSNGVWKVLAIALLSAVLSGSGVLLVGATNREPPPDLAPLTQRVAVQETKTTGLEQRLERMEEKQDRMLEILNRRSR